MNYKDNIMTEDDKENLEVSQVSYGGFWKRFIAFMIDYIITIVLIMLFAFVAGLIFALQGVDVKDPQTQMRFDLIVQGSGIIIIWLYYALFEISSTQATLGKMFLGMKVTDLNGKKLSFFGATLRFFAKILSGALMLIGFIMIAFSKKKQGLHDIIASALVVNKSK